MAQHRRLRPAVFIDRDGTLIRERNYISRPEDVVLIAGAAEGLRMLRAAGFMLVMVTNQSGIARGYFSVADLQKVNRRLSDLLKRAGARLDAVYFCPHGPGDACACRKPGLGMVQAADRRFGLDLKRSYAVGDHANDVKLGHAMGGRAVHVLTGHGRQEARAMRIKPDAVRRNFIAACRWIVKDREVAA